MVSGYVDAGSSDGAQAAAFVALLLLVVTVVLSFSVARYAQRKGYSFVLFLLLGLILSPIVSFIAAFVVVDRSARYRYR